MASSERAEAQEADRAGGATNQDQQDGPRRRGGQTGNANRMTTAHRSTKRFGVILARIGRKHAGIYHDLCRFRAAVEDLVRQRHGKLTLVDMARVQSICRLEASARLAERMLYENTDLTPAEIIKHRESVARWTVQRDNALRELTGDDAKSSAGGLASIYDDPSDDDGWFPGDDPADPADPAQDRSGRDSRASERESDSKVTSPVNRSHTARTGVPAGDGPEGEDYDDQDQDHDQAGADGLDDDDLADDPLADADDDDQADDDPAQLERDRRRLYGPDPADEDQDDDWADGL